jgi:hypothetical protein
MPSDPTATALVEAQLAEMRAVQDEMGQRLRAVERAVGETKTADLRLKS